MTGVTAIAAGAYHSLAVKNDGTLVAWGWNPGTGREPAPGNQELAGWTIHWSIVDNADFVIFDSLLMSKSEKIAGEDADSR